MIDQITKNLGKEADSLLKHQCSTIAKESLHLPGVPPKNSVLVVNTGLMKSCRKLLIVLSWRHEYAKKPFLGPWKGTELCWRNLPISPDLSVGYVLS